MPYSLFLCFFEVFERLGAPRYGKDLGFLEPQAYRLFYESRFVLRLVLLAPRPKPLCARPSLVA